MVRSWRGRRFFSALLRYLCTFWNFWKGCSNGTTLLFEYLQLGGALSHILKHLHFVFTQSLRWFNFHWGYVLSPLVNEKYATAWHFVDSLTSYPVVCLFRACIACWSEKKKVRPKLCHMARLVASSGLKDEDGRCPCHSEAACPLHNALGYQDHSDPAMSDW